MAGGEDLRREGLERLLRERRESSLGTRREDDGSTDGLVLVGNPSFCK